MAEEEDTIQSEETDESIIITTQSGDKPQDSSKIEVLDEEEEKAEEATDEGEEKATEEEVKPQIDYAAELAKVKKELDETRRKAFEPTEKADEKKVYTTEQLDAAEDMLDKQLENSEITQADYRKQLRAVQKIRDEQRDARIRQEIARENIEIMSERNVIEWAKQNAPQYLDRTTSESRAAEDFARDTLGAIKKDGKYILPENIARIMFGLVHGSTTGKTDETIKAAEKKGFEKGVESKEIRRKEMKEKEVPPKGTGKEARAEELDADERKVIEKFGVSPSLYKKIQGSMSKGIKIVEAR